MVNFEYPLQWLPQQPRTKRRERARFKTESVSRAGDYLIQDLQRMGAKNCVISSNLQVRQRGDGFYASQRVEDTGVVVYFQLKGKSKAMACDKWDRVEHNLWALYLSVSAIRGLDRWGGSEFLDGLFTGFQALPDYSSQSYFTGCNTQEEIKAKYRELAMKLHPDNNNGDDKEFVLMKLQYEQLLKQHSGGGK